MSRRSSRRSRTPGGKTPLQIFEEEEDALDNQEGVISTSSDEEIPVKKKVKSGPKVYYFIFKLLYHCVKIVFVENSMAAIFLDEAYFAG